MLIVCCVYVDVREREEGSTRWKRTFNHVNSFLFVCKCRRERRGQHQVDDVGREKRAALDGREHVIMLIVCCMSVDVGEREEDSTRLKGTCNHVNSLLCM